MLDTNTLHNIIKEIFKLDDSYIIPINSNWFIPVLFKTRISSFSSLVENLQKKRKPLKF